MPIDQFWAFYSFLDRGNCVIHKWMDDIGIKIKAAGKIEARFRYLAFQQSWEPNLAKKLKGYDDIFEIRIRYESIQFRPLGCFGPGANQFSLLIGAIEKGDVFVPKNAPEVAKQRRELIYKNRSLIHEYEEPYFGPVKRGNER